MTSLQKDILALREKKALVQMGGGEADGQVDCPQSYSGFAG